jgi:hypothetical protein
VLNGRVRLLAASLASALILAVPAADALAPTPAIASAPNSPYQLTLTPAPSAIVTWHATTFTGTVSAGAAGERPRLWRLVGNRWMLLSLGPVVAVPAGASTASFSVTHTFVVPSHGIPTELRICFPRNALNLRTCTTFAVVIKRSGRRHVVHHAAHEKRRQQREEARQRREAAHRQHVEAAHRRREEAHQRREERQKTQTREHEERRQKQTQEREARRQRHEESRQKHEAEHKQHEEARKHKAEERNEKHKQRQEEQRRRREERRSKR